MQNAIAFLFDRGEFDLAVRLIERVPSAGRVYEGKVVGEWLRQNKSPQTIEQWLLGRGWDEERLRFRARLKTDAPLVAEIVRQMRARPCTQQRAQELLNKVWVASAPVDLRWVPEWCRPPLSTDNHVLGRMFNAHPKTGTASVAAVFLERSLAPPVTQEDLRRLTMLRSVIPVRTDREWERRFRIATRLELAKAYEAMGQGERARKELETVGQDRQLAEEPVVTDFGDVVPTPPSELMTIARLTWTEAPNWPNAWRRLRREIERQAREGVLDRLSFEVAAEFIRDRPQLAGDVGWIWDTLDAIPEWNRVERLLEMIIRHSPSDQRARAITRTARLGQSGHISRACDAGSALMATGYSQLAMPLLDRAQMLEPGTTARRRSAPSSSAPRLDDLRRWPQ